MVQSEKDRLTDALVTLNGVPARICGRLNRFPTVAALPMGEAYQYCWETVRHIVDDCGGKFEVR